MAVFPGFLQVDLLILSNILGYNFRTKGGTGVAEVLFNQWFQRSLP